MRASPFRGCSLQIMGSGARGLQSLRLSGSRTGSVVVAYGLSCSAACGIFLDQGSNPCLLHWQMDSLPLSHQGSPYPQLFTWHCQPLQRLQTRGTMNEYWVSPLPPPSNMRCFLHPQPFFCKFTLNPKRQVILKLIIRGILPCWSKRLRKFNADWSRETW